MYIFVFILLIIILSLIYHSPIRKGKRGERSVSFILDRLDINSYKILNDILIFDEKGISTQIDHIVISCYGIFVIETKNYQGWILDLNLENNGFKIYMAKSTILKILFDKIMDI